MQIQNRDKSTWEFFFFFLQVCAYVALFFPIYCYCVVIIVICLFHPVMSNIENLDDNSYISDDDDHRSSMQKEYEYYEQV